MHTQHLIGRVRRIQADLRSVSDGLQLRGHTVQAEELRHKASVVAAAAAIVKSNSSQASYSKSARALAVNWVCE